MNYQLIYDRLIERGKNRVLNEYTETHHILPRCMGGTDEKANLVELTPEEHYVAHQLLVKINPANNKLIYAAMMMAAGTEYVRRSNKQYGWLKRKFSEGQTGENHLFNRDSVAREKNQNYMRGPNNPQKLNPRSGERHHTYNRKIEFNFTDEGRKILSDKMIGNKNPCSGVKPWNHPRATDYTKSVWANADHIKKVWEDNNKPSYCRLFSLVNGRSHGKDWEAIGPYMNLVKYFRNGWEPNNDKEWKK